MGNKNYSFRKVQDSDPFKETEKQLKLEDYEFPEFFKTLKDAAIDRQITLAELATAFKDCEFGKAILSQEETIVKQLLKTSIFKAKETTLDLYDLFSMGFLYCNGTVEDKVRAIFKQFDFNQNGFMEIEKLKLVFNDVILIGAVAMPAIKLKINYEDAKKFAEPQMGPFLDKCLHIMFKDKKDIDGKGVTQVMEDELKYLNNSVWLRQELVIKWEDMK